MTVEPKLVSTLPLPELIKLLREGEAAWQRNPRYDERLHRLAVLVARKRKHTVVQTTRIGQLDGA